MNSRQLLIASGCIVLQLMVGNWLLWRGTGRSDFCPNHTAMVSLSVCCIIIHFLIFTQIPLARCPWWALLLIAVAACYVIFLAGTVSGGWLAMWKNGWLHDWRTLPLDLLSAVTVSGVGALVFTPVLLLLGAIDWLWLLAFKHWR